MVIDFQKYGVFWNLIGSQVSQSYKENEQNAN